MSERSIHESAERGDWKVPYERPKRPKGEAYGVAAVTRALEGLDFPASKTQLLDKVKGHETVHWTKDQTVNLRVLFNRLGQDRFESMAGIVSALGDELQEQGRSGPTGR